MSFLAAAGRPYWRHSPWPACRLRAERSGTGAGRVYAITYQASDACGNTANETATVDVPLSPGR